MNINKIVNDCLMLIFEKMYNFEDLISCYHVCIRWRDLVSIRLAQFKYITIFDGARSPHIEGNRIPSELLVNFKQLDYDLSHRARWNRNYVCPLKSLSDEMLPNLRIINIDGNVGSRVWYFIVTDLEDFFKTSMIKGVIELVLRRIFSDNTERRQTREMYAKYKEIPTGPNLTQIRLQNCDLMQFSRINPASIPNLKILYLDVLDGYGCQVAPPMRLSLPKLETLIVTDADTKIKSLKSEFQLIDCCPKCRSAFFYLRYKKINFTGEEFKGSTSLQDLVIVFGPGTYWEWDSLKRLLAKYRKLRNLAIRIYPEITDSCLIDLVTLLPALVTLDLRECESITASAEDIIAACNKRNNRSIKLYLGPKETEPPKPRHWLGIGSNFMETFFFHNQPPILVDELGGG